MKLFVISITILLLTTINLSAQDIEGVAIGTTMTKNEVIAKFGEPDQHSYSDADDLGIDERYHYEENLLIFNNSEFIGFVVSDNRWRVLTNVVDGGVRVGDQFSKIEFLKPEVATWIDNETYYVPRGDYYLFFKISSGIIREIDFEITK